MNKLKLLASVFLLVAAVGTTKAQFAYIKPDDMDELHNRTLIVVVEKPSDEVTEKLNKKHKSDKVDAYKNAIDDFNKNLAAAVAQYWKVSENEVQYKTMDEINDISDKKNYAVLFCRSVMQPDLETSYVAKNGIAWWPDFKEVTHDKDFSSKMSVIGFALLDKFSKGAPVYQFPLPDLYPTKEDLKYAINAANAYIIYRVNHRKDSPKKIDEALLQENQPNLKDKTLLLRRDWLDKRLTNAEITKDYPYPFMVAGADTVNRAIDSADSKYAVAIVAPFDLQAAPSGGLQYVQYVYNPEDGSFMASSGIPDMPSNPKNTNASNTSANKPLITKRALLDFCMYNTDDDTGAMSKGKKGKK